MKSSVSTRVGRGIGGRMSRGTRLSVAILFVMGLALSFVPAPVTHAASSVYVQPNATGGTCVVDNITYANCYATIQAGVTAAGSGGTVNVFPPAPAASYNETVNVPFPVTILGPQNNVPGQCALTIVANLDLCGSTYGRDPSDPVSEAIVNGGFTIASGAANVRISGFVINPGGGTAITQCNDATCLSLTLQDNIIGPASGASGTGMLGCGDSFTPPPAGTGDSIQYNLFQNLTDGILANYTDKCSNALIQHNWFKGIASGAINMQDGSPHALTGLQILSNQFLNNATDIYVGSTEYAPPAFQVHYNRFFGTLPSSAIVSNAPNLQVQAQNNWYGCNDGPTDATYCKTATATGATNTQTPQYTPWLILRTYPGTVSTCTTTCSFPTTVTLPASGQTQVVADLRYNNINTLTPGVPDGTKVKFTAQAPLTFCATGTNTLIAYTGAKAGVPNSGHGYAVAQVCGSGSTGGANVCAKVDNTVGAPCATVVVNGGITGSTLSPNPVEGQNWSGTVGTFTDPDGDPASNFSATIDWNDGTSSTGTVTSTGPGTYAVSGSHTYAEEGTYHPVISVHDSGDGSNLTGSGTANVVDAPITSGAGSPAGAPLTVAPTEGVSFTGVVAKFYDPAPEAAGNYLATISWGDGASSTGTVSATGTTGVYQVTGTHTYAEEGSKAGLVTIQDDGNTATTGGTVTTVGFTANVADAPLTVSGVPAYGCSPSTACTHVVATFTDANSFCPAGDYSATINWNDGSAPDTTGIITNTGGCTYSVTGTHTFLFPGTYTVHTTVTDVGGQSGSGNTTVTVGPPGPTPFCVVANGSYDGTNPNYVSQGFTANVVDGYYAYVRGGTYYSGNYLNFLDSRNPSTTYHIYATTNPYTAIVFGSNNSQITLYGTATLTVTTGGIATNYPNTQFRIDINGNNYSPNTFRMRTSTGYDSGTVLEPSASNRIQTCYAMGVTLHVRAHLQSAQ